MLDGSEPTPAVMFDDLGIKQLSGDGPDAPALPESLDPRAEVCGQGIEIECQAIAGEDG